MNLVTYQCCLRFRIYWICLHIFINFLNPWQNLLPHRIDIFNSLICWKLGSIKKSQLFHQCPLSRSRTTLLLQIAKIPYPVIKEIFFYQQNFFLQKLKGSWMKMIDTDYFQFYKFSCQEYSSFQCKTLVVAMMLKVVLEWL